VVFGCAGDRDPGRRPAMARAAAELADYVVVTSENTWREPAEQVIAELTDGLDRVGLRRDRDYTVRVDRQEAIELALSAAEIGDTVLVAGMGHEPTMVVAGEARPWDDRAVIREVLSPAVPVSR
jgi:UDP-N-acetylmuramoyl-L-alanyl-D-glutamate--2,6-diaminopimelate ligase